MHFRHFLTDKQFILMTYRNKSINGRKTPSSGTIVTKKTKERIQENSFFGHSLCGAGNVS